MGSSQQAKLLLTEGFFHTHWICYCAVSQLGTLSEFLLADLPLLFAVLSLPCGVCDTFPSCALSYEGHHNRCSPLHRVLQQRGSVCVCVSVYNDIPVKQSHTLQHNSCHKGLASSPPHSRSRFLKDLCCSAVLAAYSYKWKVSCITWPIDSRLFECVSLYQLRFASSATK